MKEPAQIAERAENENVSDPGRVEKRMDERKMAMAIGQRRPLIEIEPKLRWREMDRWEARTKRNYVTS